MNEFWLDQFIPLIREVIDSDGEFRLYPRGTSMLPLLRQGIDSVALSRPGRLKRGDILLYQRESGQYVLHRLWRVRRDGSLWFSGDNHMIVEKGIDRGQIIASAVAVFRGDCRKDSNSFMVRAYSKFMTFYLFKGFIIFLRRITGAFSQKK